MYAPVTVAALDIQSASQASISTNLYMAEGSMKLSKKRKEELVLF
jgi:hypothetical protein